jgi:hypothetical protein
LDQCSDRQTIQIRSPQSANTRSANLIRNCVTTHSFNGSQGLVDLDVTSRNGGIVAAQVPQDAKLAPPGWYTLFLVDDRGWPSLVRWRLN